VTLLCCTCSRWRADQPDTTARDERTLNEARIASDGPSLLEFFRKRTVSSTDLERIKKLIADLGDDSFEVRQNASAQLVTIGAAAVPLLRQATKDSDVEIVRRAEDCLKHIETGGGTAIVAAAARLLALRQANGTAEVLLAYLPAVEDEIVGDAVRVTLKTIAVRDGKADPVLVAALADKNALRRGGAATALIRAKAEDQKPAIRKLLEDP